MENLWSHRLPLTPTNKGKRFLIYDLLSLTQKRATQRAVSDHAIIYDASYTSVIEVESHNSSFLVSLLQSLQHPVKLHNISFRSFLDGNFVVLSEHN